MRKIILCIVIIIFIKRLTNYKIQNDVIPDIIIGPAGKYGFYSLGMCHYIKNNFNIENKKIIGFSAGSWCALMLTLKKELINEFLNKIFQIKNIKINIMLDKLENICSQYSIDNFDIQNTWIAITNTEKKKLCFYNNFLSMDEYIRGCKTSSFIPLITSKSPICFYKNNLSLDGSLMYKKYKKSLIESNVKPLIISPQMFGKNKNGQMYKEIYKTSIINVYNSYIKGYSDASKNHKYFKSYLNEL